MPPNRRVVFEPWKLLDQKILTIPFGDMRFDLGFWRFGMMPATQSDPPGQILQSARRLTSSIFWKSLVRKRYSHSKPLRGRGNRSSKRPTYKLKSTFADGMSSDWKRARCEKRYTGRHFGAPSMPLPGIEPGSRGFWRSHLRHWALKSYLWLYIYIYIICIYFTFLKYSWGSPRRTSNVYKK